MNARTAARKGRKPKGGTPTFLRIPDDLRSFIVEVRESEKRSSISNAAVALLYEAREARRQRAEAA
jgi:hypothetical protein